MFLTKVLNKYLPDFAKPEPNDREGFSVGIGYGVFHFAEPKDHLMLSVREPLACISSLAKRMGYRDEYARYTVNNTKNDWNQSDLTLAMGHYLYWNTQCEALLNGQRPRQIEDVSDWLPTVIKLSGCALDYEELQRCIDSVDTNINGRKRPANFTWEELEEENILLTRGIKQMAERYGYEQ